MTEAEMKERIAALEAECRMLNKVAVEWQRKHDALESLYIEHNDCHQGFDAKERKLEAELQQARATIRELRDLNVAGWKIGDWHDLKEELSFAIRGTKHILEVNASLQQELQQAREREARLRKTIEDAPHWQWCSAFIVGRTLADCDCWKKYALKNLPE